MGVHGAWGVGMGRRRLRGTQSGKPRYGREKGALGLRGMASALVGERKENPAKRARVQGWSPRPGQASYRGTYF